MKVSNKGAFRHEIISNFGSFNDDEIRVNNKNSKQGKDFFNSYDDDDDYDNRSRKKVSKPITHNRIKGKD